MTSWTRRRWLAAVAGAWVAGGAAAVGASVGCAASPRRAAPAHPTHPTTHPGAPPVQPPPPPTPAAFDAVIIGGGPAGMSAALVLGRGRKRVLVIDAQRPRHAVADAVHGFLTREGVSPADLRRIGRAQLAAFPSVTFTDDTADAITDTVDDDTAAAVGGFIIQTASGARVTARTVLLALGVIDQHPKLPGYDALWGRSVFLCPFCHGWESRDQPIGVLNHGEAGVHQALLLRGWSDDVTLFTDGHPLPDDAAPKLAAASVTVEPAPVTALLGDGPHLTHVRLSDGRDLPRAALFVRVSQRQTPLIESLGLRLAPSHPMSDSLSVAVDMMMGTSRPGIWAAGDCTTLFQSVLEAAAQGARAAAVMTMHLTHAARSTHPKTHP